MSDMKRLIVLFLAISFLTVPVTADDTVEFDFIKFDVSADYGENASVKDDGEGCSLDLTEVTFDISGKSVTGDIVFDVKSEESAEIAIAFAGDGEAVFSFSIPERSRFIISVPKDEITENAGPHPSSLTLRSSSPVTLLSVRSSRIRQSFTVPIVLTAAFLATAFMLPVFYYEAKSRRSKKKRFI